MTAITIQQIGADSLEVAFHLLVQFFSEEGFDTPAAEMKASLETMIAASSNTVFLAWQDGEPVGVATVMTSVGLEYGKSAEIEDLYVLPHARKQGVAELLIEEICAWCQVNGVTTVLVTVTAEGDARHNLLEYYQQRGFTDNKRLILERSLGVRPKPTGI
jgi:GNAT superfamily N-acetyltransferase